MNSEINSEYAEDIIKLKAVIAGNDGSTVLDIKGGNAPLYLHSVNACSIR